MSHLSNNYVHLGAMIVSIPNTWNVRTIFWCITTFKPSDIEKLSFNLDVVMQKITSNMSSVKFNKCSYEQFKYLTLDVRILN